MGPRPVVLVFVRQWDAGPVKTRLAADVGRARATAIYKELAESVWAGLAHDDYDRWLVVEPASALEAAHAWLPGATRVLGQTDGDLGERLRAACDAAFASGAPIVAVVGTDAPALDAARVDAALRALDAAEVSMIPARDGGYALLASRRPVPELFEGIPWSTGSVAEHTRARARENGLRLLEGEPVRDLDTGADLEALALEGWVLGAGSGPFSEGLP